MVLSMEEVGRIRRATYEDMADPAKATQWLEQLWAAVMMPWTQSGLVMVREANATLECMPNNSYHGQQVRYLGEQGGAAVLSLTLDWTVAMTLAQLGGQLELWVGRIVNDREVARVDMQIGLFSVKLNPEWDSVWPRVKQSLLADFQKRCNGTHHWAQAYQRTRDHLVADSLDWIAP